MKVCTDIEQSKKLAEILPLESADMWFANGIVVARDSVDEPDDIKSVIPCWSLAALMNLLPSEITEKGEHSETTYEIDIRKYALTDDVDIYQIAYGNYRWHEDRSRTWSDIINTGEKEDLLDAAFEMVCWLKENGKI